MKSKSIYLNILSLPAIYISYSFWKQGLISYMEGDMLFFPAKIFFILLTINVVMFLIAIINISNSVKTRFLNVILVVIHGTQLLGLFFILIKLVLGIFSAIYNAVPLV